jgi:alkylation response protein AidB-like acyl-CoA dehydrogenase
MSAHLTDEQRAFIETARRFARERLAPRYQARENDGASSGS